MDDHERERRTEEAREKHRAEVQARVDKALKDPGLKAALQDLKAQTPEGEAMFGFQVKANVADARAEVPAAETVATAEGVAIVTQREAAAAYVAAKVPARLSPRMPTGRIKVPMRAEEIAQRRQATMPSLRKGDAAEMRVGVADGNSADESAADESAADESAADESAVDEHAADESGAFDAGDASTATTARRDASRGMRRGWAIGAVALFGAAMVAIGLLRGRSGNGASSGVSESTTARAESAALVGLAAPTCANMGRSPCPTVSESAEPVAVTSAGAGSTGPRVNASATTAGSASTTAKATSTSTDEVYPDAAAPPGSATASALPRIELSPSTTSKPETTAAAVTTAAPAPSPGTTVSRPAATTAPSLDPFKKPVYED